MKQLFKSGNATTLFFKDETTLEDIRDWVKVEEMLKTIGVLS